MTRLMKIGAMLAIVGLILFFLYYEPPPPRQTPFAFAGPLTMPTIEREVRDEEDLPFLGIGVADFDLDGTPEIFIGGDATRPDKLLRAEVVGRTPRLTDISGLAKIELPKPGPTYGFTPVDVDEDGDMDFYVARDDGITLYTNTTPPPQAGQRTFPQFDVTRLDLQFPPGAVPVGVAVADLNRNEVPDLAVALWPRAAKDLDDPIGEAPATIGPRVFIDDTQGGYIDSTDRLGLPSTRSVTGLSFADMNNDQIVDLVATYQDGQIVVVENRQNLSFRAHRVQAGLGFLPAMTLSDVNRDGLLDIVAGGLGDGDVGDGVAGSERTSWGLLINNGEFRFSDQAASLGFTSVHRAHAIAAPDLDSDGRPDFVAGVEGYGWQTLAYFPLPSPVALPIYYENNQARVAELRANAYNDESALSQLPDDGSGQQIIAADLFGDGSEDVILIPREGEISLYVSETPVSTLRNFVLSQLSLTAGAIGSRVLLEVKAAPRGLELTDYTLTRHVISNAIGANVAMPLVFGVDTPTLSRMSLYTARGTRRVRSTSSVASQQMVILD